MTDLRTKEQIKSSVFGPGQGGLKSSGLGEFS